MRTTRRYALLSAFLAAAFGLSAAGPPGVELWPAGAPGEAGAIGPERVVGPAEGERRVTRVHDVAAPSITVYRPPVERANGTAILVAPGGGYNILAWDLEGVEVAEWLNSLGVTAVLLKYRVPRRDKDQPHRAPLQDAQRAVRLVRQRAAEWGVHPSRIGMLGFSAGGHLTVMTGLHAEDRTYERIDAADGLSARPDFLIPIYAAYLGEEDRPWELSPLVRVTPQSPPMFLAVTHDDKERGAQAALLLAELKKNGVPAELHVFLKGGHGYGLRPTGDPVSSWPQLCESWMRVMGYLPPAHPASAASSP